MSAGNTETHHTTNKSTSDIKGFQKKAAQYDMGNDQNHSRNVCDGSRQEDFYKLTSKDLKKNQKLRELEIERESQLRTKETREREKRSVPKSKVTKIRIRKPNGEVVESTFDINDKLHKVYQLIDRCFSNGKAYTLLVPPATSFKETDKEKTLADLQLYPAVLLTIKWKQ